MDKTHYMCNKHRVHASIILYCNSVPFETVPNNLTHTHTHIKNCSHPYKCSHVSFFETPIRCCRADVLGCRSLMKALCSSKMLTSLKIHLSESLIHLSLANETIITLAYAGSMWVKLCYSLTQAVGYLTVSRSETHTHKKRQKANFSLLLPLPCISVLSPQSDLTLSSSHSLRIRGETTHFSPSLETT